MNAMYLRVFALLLVILFTVMAQRASAQNTPIVRDTLRLNLRQADSMLLANNLSLIAQKYSIDAAEGQIVQARLFANPNLTVEGSLFNSQTNKFFDLGANGEEIASLTQTFSLAGKRDKSIKIAEAQKTLSQLQYELLARTLKLQLRQAFFTAAMLELSRKEIDRQLDLLQETVKGLEAESQKGNVSLKEIVRLKAEVMGLFGSRSDLTRQIIEAQSSLRTLLASQSEIVCLPSDEELHRYDAPRLKLEDLKKSALENNPDLKGAEAVVAQSQLGLDLAQSMATPDLTVGLNYDRAGSYVNNYLGLSIGVNVPIFDRNQGNIQSAEANLDQTRWLARARSSAVISDVETAYNKALEADRQNALMDSTFRSQFTALNNTLIQHYRSRDISILEFTDLFEAYIDTQIMANQVRLNRLNALEELNFAVGEELF